MAGRRRVILERIEKFGWSKDHPEYLATIPPEDTTPLGEFIAKFANSVGDDQFLSKKEWLSMNGICDAEMVLATCAGGDAYRIEMMALERKRVEKGSEK